MSPVPPRLAALLLAAAAAAHAQPAAPGWRLSLASDRHVDALALGRLGDDEAARALDPRAGRNLGYLFDELRLERRGSDGTRVVLLARQRAIAIASAGALELARQVETGGTPGHDRDWRVDLDHLGFAGAGLELGTRDLALAPGLTLALSALGFTVAFRWTSITGGENGLGGIERPLAEQAGAARLPGRSQ